MTLLADPAAPSATRLRPITLAILAMGGEGGGVLADWVVAMAEDNGWFAQNTSVAGVAQRTGATVYYVELLPRVAGAGEPVLSTMPTPGEVDVVIASELMEAGRAIQRGFSTPDRTTLIASTNRVYAMPERTAMGDGRIDAQQLISACQGSSRTFIRADFAKVAEDAGSVISASLLGALAASGALPFDRPAFEATIRSGGKGIEASLRAFDAGFVAAERSLRPTVDISIGTRPADAPTDHVEPDAADVARAEQSPEALVGERLRAQALRILEFPRASRWMLVQGIKRTAEYQDVHYADEYLDRVARISTIEPDPEGTAELTTAAARYVALWMTYEDTIRVAFHKTRQRRFTRVRDEARVNESQVMQVREFLHPQIEEITDTLPTALGRWLLRSRPFRWLVHKTTHKGLIIQTTSVWGFTVLYVLARMQPIRRRSLRFGQEQQRIDAWLTKAVEQRNTDTALQIILCQQLIKGYGETHARGLANFDAIIDALPRLEGLPQAAETVASLRAAALADDSGSRLREALSRV